MGKLPDMALSATHITIPKKPVVASGLVGHDHFFVEYDDGQVVHVGIKPDAFNGTGLCVWESPRTEEE